MGSAGLPMMARMDRIEWGFAAMVAVGLALMVDAFGNGSLLFNAQRDLLKKAPPPGIPAPSTCPLACRLEPASCANVLGLRIQPMETAMPRGDKSSYTHKQKRQAEHIEEGYEHRGVPEKEAERRAWATVNKETHGGKKSGSGRGTEEDRSPSRKGGRLGGAAAAKRPASERSRSAKKAARTRKRRAA